MDMGCARSTAEAVSEVVVSSAEAVTEAGDALARALEQSALTCIYDMMSRNDDILNRLHPEKCFSCPNFPPTL